MEIGFPNNPRKDILKEIKWIGKKEFDFVDLFLQEDKAIPKEIDVKKTKKLINKYNLGAVGHLDWRLPIGSPIKTLRKSAVEEAKRYFKILDKLPVKYVTIHANWPGGMFSDKEGIEFQVETLKELKKESKKHNFEIMYELIPTELDTVKNVSKILKKVPNLKFHLDIGHANLYGKDVRDFIKKFHKRLVHVHLHDNDGAKDQHLPMGCGEINWEKLLKALKKHYDGTITLEVFSKDKDYALATKNKLRKLWKEK